MLLILLGTLAQPSGGPPFPSVFKTIAVDCSYGSSGLIRTIFRSPTPVVNVGDAAVMFITLDPWVQFTRAFSVLVTKPDGSTFIVSGTKISVGQVSQTTWVGTFEPGVYLQVQFFPGVLDQFGGYTVQVEQNQSLGNPGTFFVSH